MSNPSLPESPESGRTAPEGQAAKDFNGLWYLRFWPALVAGLIITVGIVGLNPDPTEPSLLTGPPLVAGALLLLAIILLPRPKKQAEAAWEKLERERLSALPPAPAKPVAAATQPEAVEAPTAPETAPVPQATTAPAAGPADVDILIMWGSETGTAQGLAEVTEKKLKDGGHSAKAMGMDHVKLSQLPGFNKVLVITSTWGDGEPPSNAIDLWESFQKEKADLSKTRFSVLSLGDTAYPEFCKCGKDFDQFLESQGAKRLYPRVDCDLGYEANFEKWLSGVQQALG